MKATKLVTLFSLLSMLAISVGAIAQPVDDPAAHATPAPILSGRYVRNAGERPAKISRAGSKSRDLGTEPYTASYLPRSTGPLAHQNDSEIKRQITEGFGGGCDLVHQIIKDNATKDSAAKLEAAGNPGFRERYLREGYDTTAEGWTGFCHNWAPAGLDKGINFMVSMDKIYADIPFGIGDMRELATFTLPDSYDHAWFGKRHNDKDSAEKPEDELDPVDLLTIMENYVGEGKPGIVLDVDPGYMVWNQPVYKWTRNATRVEGTDAIAALGSKRPPNKGRVYEIDLTATYGVESSFAHRGETVSRDISWKMVVYTDRDGNIVDSQWSGYNKIPDFAWAPKDRSTNPEFATLEKIAKDGVSVKDIETFCATMASLPAGDISKKNKKDLKKLLDKICPVLDQNKLSDLIRTTAERTGQDYSALESAIRSNTEAHI